FEITLNFEIIEAPNAGDAGKAGTRLSLAISKETPHANVATINRSFGVKGGGNFVSWQSLWNEATGKPAPPNANVYSTNAKTGRLRLVRAGPHLYYGWSEGFDGDIKFRSKYNFGDEDLREMRIIGSTGGDKASLSARVSDFRIRADAIPNMPASAQAPGG